MTDRFMAQDADCHSMELSCRRVGDLGLMELVLSDSGRNSDEELSIWLAKDDARGLANHINKELA